jgi:Uma2 family endonuclease
MSIELPPEIEAVIYPDSDGKPIADNTLQFQWIVTIKENLEVLFADQPEVFVAGDLLWYPVRGKPTIRRAPDALVAFGRPKGYRGSYIQHREDDIAPQVVFEVLSPKNTRREMAQKLAFYDTYGVEEYYLYDPDHNRLSGWLRNGDQLRPLAAVNGWVSPRLGIHLCRASIRCEFCIPMVSLFSPLWSSRRLPIRPNRRASRPNKLYTRPNSAAQGWRHSYGRLASSLIEELFGNYGMGFCQRQEPGTSH